VVHVLGWTNRVRQIVLAAPFDTVSGIYPFTLIVRNQYATGPFDATQTGFPSRCQPEDERVWRGLVARRRRADRDGSEWK